MTIENAKQKAYWTTFAFEGHHPNDLHCTHKYLGELDNPEQVEQTIDDYFFRGPYALGGLAIGEILFDQSALFGEAGDIKVLVINPIDAEFINKKFSNLRSQLDLFRADDYPEYRPHVTTDRAVFVGNVDRYMLMQGDKVIQEWRLL